MSLSPLFFSILTPLSWGALLSFLFSLFVVFTTRWHGVFTLDASHGVQKLHAHPTPRVGGLPIFLALLIALMGAPASIQNEMQVWVIAALPAFVFGLTEDLTKRVSVTVRLIATMGSGVLAWYLTGEKLTDVNVIGLNALFQLTPFAVLFTAFAVGGVANAINIIDGLNGLASSVVFWALLGVSTLAATLGDQVLAGSCLLMASCVFGFFLVNWPWGKLFLGDGGAYFLGFILAWACVLLIERHDEVSAFAAVLLCIHPITEVFYSVYRRKLRHRHPGHPDQLHFHSLLKRRVMQRLFPSSSKTMRNSLGGVLMGSMSLWAAFLVQFTYHSTVASVLAIVFMVMMYLALYKRIVLRLS